MPPIRHIRVSNYQGGSNETDILTAASLVGDDSGNIFFAGYTGGGIAADVCRYGARLGQFPKCFSVGVGNSMRVS